MSDPVGEKLCDAARNGRVFEVLSLLRDHPEVNVNLKGRFGQTPLSFACQSGKVGIVQELLRDPRVDVTLHDSGWHTPLWWASWNGNREVVEWLMASGRDLGDIENKKDWKGNTARDIARKENKTEVASLLERFIANPTLTRYEVRMKLGVLNEVVAEVFALTVFLCDDLLELKPASHLAATPHPATTTAAAARFFAIAKRLPMELQMILCHNVVGSMKQNILLKDSEPAFKSLASRLLLSPHE